MKPFSIEEYRQIYLSESRLNELYTNKLFKLFVPKTYGGLELSMRDGLSELERIAAMQGGMGWTINLGAGANWFSGFFNDEAAREIFTPEQAVIAGSGFTSGTCSEVEEDMFSINGTWSRCTGAKHASFFSLNAKNDNGLTKTFVVPRSQVELADEKWQIFGLRNTSSYAININHQIVPERYSFTINSIKNPHAYLVHDIPFETFARLCMSASFIGMVKCLIVKSKEHPLNEVSLDYCIQNIEPLIQKASSECKKWADEISEKIQSTEFNDENAKAAQTALGNNNIALYEQVQQLFLLAGLPLVEEDTIVHWAYRDVLTAVQHYMVKP